MAIHSHRKDFWRFPEDRILISRLIKNPEARLEFSLRESKWKINGKKVSLDGKTWGKFHELFFRVFREIRFAFQGQYKKNFYLAKDAIYRTHAEATRKELEEEWHIDKRRKSLPFLDKKAQKARARMKKVLKNTEEYKAQVDQSYLAKLAKIDQALIDLEPQLISIKNFLKTKKYQPRDVLFDHPRYCRLYLPNLKSSEVEKLLRKAVKERERLELERKEVQKRYTILTQQLEKIKTDYRGEDKLVKKAIVAISQSPLKPERPLVVRKLF